MTRPEREVREIKGLAEIAHLYDGYILDQYGVLHNGSIAFAGVLECVKWLRDAGKVLLILSNAGRKEDYVRVRLGPVSSVEHSSEMCCISSQFL